MHLPLRDRTHLFKQKLMRLEYLFLCLIMFLKNSFFVLNYFFLYFYIFWCIDGKTKFKKIKKINFNIFINKNIF
jgi:hypothetical protein